MLSFSYRGYGAGGAAESGVIEARNQTDAMRELQRRGTTVTDIRLGSAPVDTEAILNRHASGNVRRDDVIAFTAQLAVMLETGVPLREALKAYVQQSKPGPLRRIMSTIADRITGGASFSEAISEFPRVFPRMMVSLMRASEATGTMDVMLGRISSYLGKERRTARQIKGAMTYPAVMIALALTITGFLVVWVLPRFAKIYESREAALPTLTKVVLGSSRFVIGNWPAIIAGAAAVVGLLFMVRLMPRGRRFIDLLKVRTPVIGTMYTKFYLTRATRTLGTLLGAGVSLLEAIRIVRGVTENALWSELWDDVERSMTSGRSITDAITNTKLIPPAVAQMIAAGERTGRLPEVLDRVSSAAEEELDEAVKNATQLIEPAMIVFMGVTIGGIAISLLLPIFSVSSVMSGR